MKRAAVVVLFLAVIGSAAAQAPAPIDSVTVTAQQEQRKVIDAFIADQAAPAGSLEQIARWKVPVCPMAVGVPKNFAGFVEKRIREVAAQMGAPVRDGSCKQNVSIIFTTEPQAIVNEIRRRSSAFIGYHHSTAQGDELAKVTHPLQAWHMTGVRDLRGNVEVDNPRGRSNATVMRYPLPEPPSPPVMVEIPAPRAASVSGGRLGNGLSSEFVHVLIVADVKWAAEPEIGTIADAMAMLALSHPALSDTCRSLPSILDLLARDCARGAQTTALTAEDLAFLTGLYRMKPDDFLAKQKDEVGFQMQKALNGR